MGGTTGTINLASGTLSGTGNRNLAFGSVSGQRVTITGPSTAIIDCGGLVGFTQSGSQLGALNVIGITMTNCRPAIRFSGAVADGAFTNVSFIGNGEINTPYSGAVAAKDPPVVVGSTNFRPVFAGCLFKDNVAVGGAAIAMTSSATPSVRSALNIVVNDCTFINNTASYRGGAICMWYMATHGQTTLTNLVFTGNRAYTDGAATYLGLMFNSVLPAQPDFDNWTVDQSVLTQPDTSSDSRLGIVNFFRYYIYMTRITITNSIIYGNNANITAAGLVLQFIELSHVSDIVVRNTTIINPGSDFGSGGLLLDSTPQIMDNVQILDNVIGDGSVGRGAGVYVYGPGVPYTWTNSRIAGNKAAVGGGLWAEGIGNITWQNVTFDSNTAAQRGGAAYLGSGSEMTFINCTFTNNAASSAGGAFMVDASQPIISGGSLSSNTAASGGAVYVTSAGQVTMLDATFESNVATNTGGALVVQPNTASPVLASITRCTFSANRAQNGGAVYATSDANVTVSDSFFDSNSAATQGGAIYLNGTEAKPVTFDALGNVTFVSNNATEGGALSLFGSQPDLGAASVLPRPGESVCCEDRCVVCDNFSSIALISSAGVVCPGLTCPTPAPTPPPTTPPPTTQGPFGPCLTTNDCGPEPKLGSLSLSVIVYCCNGQWIIEENTTASANESQGTTIEVFAGGNIVINNFWNLTVIDTLVIHIDGSGNRRRQTQDALAKVVVNGDAIVNGRLEIIVDSDPQPSLETTPVPVVAIVPSSNGTLTGEFQEPIRVTLAYAGAQCDSGAANQNADSAGIDALVNVDSKKCGGGGRGLSRNGKIAVGVVCGVVGLLLLLLLVFILIKTLAPDLAVRLGLSKSSSVTLGSSYSKRNLGRV